MSDCVLWGLAPFLPGLAVQAQGAGPSLSQFHLSRALILAGPCLFLLAWVKGPSVRLAICLVLWKGLGAASCGHEGGGTDTSP